MRRRTTSRSYWLVRLLLCLILLAQSGMVSAAPSGWPNRAGRTTPATADGTSPNATRSIVSTDSLANTSAASCTPNACAIYLPWIMAGGSFSTTPTVPPMAPTPPTPTPTPPMPASDTEPPSAPSNLRTISKTATTISLAWDAAADNIAVTEYALNSSSTLILTTTGLSATISALSASTSYTFTVIARDAAGNSSPPSAPLAIITNASASPATDMYEPDNSASQAHLISLDAIQQHIFSVSGDQDWVAFSASAGETYIVETLNLAPNVDTYLELYDRDGTTLLNEDDDSNGQYGSRIWQPITTSGTYYVKARHVGGTSGDSSYSYDLRLTLADTEPPSTPANFRLISKTNATVELAWDAAIDNVAVNEYYIYHDGMLIGTSSVAAYTLAGLMPATVYTLRVQAGDSGGNGSELSNSIAITTELPPDPAAISPPVDQTVASDIAGDTAFIYSGVDPIQSGVAFDTIQAQHVAILRGRVVDRDSGLLAGVHISVRNHPEYGGTASRTDGAFDLAVNGGGQLTIDYQKEGYLPVQRQVVSPWRDYVTLPDVALVALDQAVTTISLDETSPLQAASGSVVSDTDGIRQALLIFPANTTAILELPDGTEQPLTTLHVRATEYTVGERGPQAMPGTLPVESGYTYAVEYSVDEALAAGAQQVRFSQPVFGYVENFLNFPVGEAVPAGTYDRERATWVASDSGLIIKIVDIVDGRAELDLDGDGQADDSSVLAISDAEREQLAGRYAVGQELWRVPVPHFSAWDFN